MLLRRPCAIAGVFLPLVLLACENAAPLQPDPEPIADTVLTDPGLAFTGSQTAQFPWNVWLAKSDGSAGVQVTSAAYLSLRPIWSPDGKSLTFWTQKTNDSAFIEIMSANGSGRTQIATGLRFSQDPSWSPDGQLIVFDGRGDGVAMGYEELYVIAPDGSGRRALGSGQTARHPAWSPDGSTIAFTALRDERTPSNKIRWLYLMNADGSNIRRAAAALDSYIFDPRWSPDGSFLAFEAVAFQGAQDDIYVMTAATGELRQLTTMIGKEAEPTWTPDGSRLAFTRTESGVRRLYSIKLDGSDMTPLPCRAAHCSQASFRPTAH